MSVSPLSRNPSRNRRTVRGRERLDADAASFLGQVLRNVGSMAYRRRPDDRMTLEFASPSSLRVTGFEPRDLVDPDRTSYVDIIHPKDRTRVQSAVADAVRSGAPYRLRYRLRGVDGTERWVSDHGYVTRDEDGSVVLDGLLIEDDAPPPTSQGLDQRYRALIEQSLAGVYLIEDDRFTWVNERFAEIFGYDIDEILALPSILALVSPEDRALVANNLRHRIEGRTDEVRYEFRGLTSDGHCVQVEVHGRRIEVDGTPRVLGILLDTTQRKRAELGARQSEKLDALARMAGGVSHDLNNFLSTIRSTAEVLELERAGDPDLARDLAEIVAAVDRGTNLSKQLSTFARSGANEREEITRSPDAVLSDLAQTLHPLLGRRIELRTELDDELPEVPLAAGDLHHAVMNLVLNAQDAMQDGGVLTIRATCAPPGLRSPGEIPRLAKVLVEVSDTGCGMIPAHRERLFEPYFTTKSDDTAGLGLSTVWRIVQGAGGSVEVESRPGQGSTFRLVLPAQPPG